jgi:hypothetical protein
MIRDHPSVGQVHIFLKLDSDHFGICLDDDTFEPFPDPVTFCVFMVTVDLNRVADLKNLFAVRRTTKTQLSHLLSLAHLG